MAILKLRDLILKAGGSLVKTTPKNYMGEKFDEELYEVSFCLVRISESITQGAVCEVGEKANGENGLRSLFSTMIPGFDSMSQDEMVAWIVAFPKGIEGDELMAKYLDGYLTRLLK